MIEKLLSALGRYERSITTKRDDFVRRAGNSPAALKNLAGYQRERREALVALLEAAAREAARYRALRDYAEGPMGLIRIWDDRRDEMIYDGKALDAVTDELLVTRKTGT